MLLIYEFKAQIYDGSIAHKVESLDNAERSYLPSNTEDSIGLHSNDEEEVDKIIKDLGKNKKKMGKARWVKFSSLRLI